MCRYDEARIVERERRESEGRGRREEGGKEEGRDRKERKYEVNKLRILFDALEIKQ